MQRKSNVQPKHQKKQPHIIKIKLVIPPTILNPIVKSLFKPECHETSGVFVMKKEGSVYHVTKVIKQHYSKNAVLINTLNKTNNEFSSFHTHPLSCLHEPGYKCVMGWPSQADFVLCFLRSLGLGIKEKREAFTLVFTHEGYYIIQVHNELIHALRYLNYMQINEIGTGIDKAIDSYKIEERRVADPKQLKPGRHAYSTPVITKDKKLKELKNMVKKVTFEKALKYIPNKTKYNSLCKNNTIQIFFIRFVPYNAEYDSRKKLNVNALRGGTSIPVRKSMMMKL